MIVDLKKQISAIKSKELYRHRMALSSAQGGVVRVKGEEFINFSSNDYLGFADDKDLKNHMIETIEKYGIGSGSSQLLTGHNVLHKSLENDLADFLKRDSALVFSSGYLANLAIASTLIDSSTIVIQDKYNHASLIDAALLSRGKLIRYSHNNLGRLKTILEKHKENKKLVITEGVFSMDGDSSLLQEVSVLCKAYKALLIVDDAHGIGVIGKTGAGVLEECGLNQRDIPLLIGTFGKSFGASGAFIAGSFEFIDLFIQKARTYIYTTALLPAIASTMSLAIKKIKEGDELRLKIKRLVEFYLSNISSIETGSKSFSHIQPFIIGGAEEAISCSKKLYEKKFLVHAIRPPTVPEKTARLRISITASHTMEDIRKLTKELKFLDKNE